MKKLLVLAIVALVAVGSAFADTLQVKGDVAEKLVVGITNPLITVSFDGTGAAGTSNLVANLNIKANKKTWKVTFSSVTDGVLTSPTTGISIPYYVKATLLDTWAASVTNTLVDAVQIGAEDKTIIATANGKTPVEGVDYSLVVSVNTQSAADVLWEAANDYTDTLTITIAAN